MTNEPGGHDPARIPRDPGADGSPPPVDDSGPDSAATATTPTDPPTPDAPTPDGPTPDDGPTPHVSTPDGPTLDAPAPDVSTPDGPTEARPVDDRDEPIDTVDDGAGPTRGPELTDDEPAYAGAASRAAAGGERPLGGGSFPPPNFPPGPPPGPPPGDGPRFGTPPPGGWNFAPGTDGYATRYGLARPSQGRVIAGVCAAVGRATNTDPVLWRVLFAVFSLAGGLGLVLYLLGWLLIPAEGDSGSPVEALFGRGRTSTNPLVIVAATVGAAIGLSVVIGRHEFWSVAVVVGIAVALVVYGTRNGNVGSPARPGPVPRPGPMPYGSASYGPAAHGPAPYAPAGPGPVPPGAPAWSTAAPTAPPYRPPFAPHGPYPTNPPGPQYPPPTYVGVRVPPVPPTPKPPRQRSKLALLTCSLALVALGVLGLLDVGTLNVPVAAYLALALAVVAAGLIVGAWLGRARGLIGLGLVLALLLGLTSFTSHMEGPGMRRGAGDVTWAPTTVADLTDQYSHGIGDVTLDLSEIDFTGTDRTVELTLNIGDATVLLPANVDVVVNAQVDAGDAEIFDQNWDGLNTGPHTATDLGRDGAGGGHLTLNIRMNAGSLEVTR
jgi:phage shock protein PspC (stress-responsive transcriptional regulator)